MVKGQVHIYKASSKRYLLQGWPILVTNVTWPPGDNFTISPVARLVYTSPFHTWNASGPNSLSLYRASALFNISLGANAPVKGWVGSWLLTFWTRFHYRNNFHLTVLFILIIGYFKFKTYSILVNFVYGGRLGMKTTKAATRIK